MGSSPADLLSALPQLLDRLIAVFGQYAPAVAFSAAFVETLAGLGVIVPGGTAVILAGFAARDGGAGSFLAVAVAAWIGMTLGAAVDYWLGRLAGHRLVPRWLPWRLATRWRRLLRSSRGFMRRWGWWAIAIANIAGPGRSSLAVAAGASGWSFGSFLAGQAIASAAWSVLYSGLGHVAAGEVERVQVLVSGAGMAMAVMLILALFGPTLAGMVARAAGRRLRPALPRSDRTAPKTVPAAPSPPTST
ncbi:MAG: DedA family protein [Chloroflexota bacterium]